jgi:addiction module HigA family antidote
MLKRGMRAIHPGELLREDVINANELTIAGAAKLLGVTRNALSNVLKEKSDISPDMCIRIAAVFGGNPQIWADLQSDFNLSKAIIRMKDLHLEPFQQIRKTA